VRTASAHRFPARFAPEKGRNSEHAVEKKSLVFSGERMKSIPFMQNAQKDPFFLCSFAVTPRTGSVD
jgi:hypothetical protein